MAKFIFFGTPYVARDTLEQLYAHGYLPEVVVTSPDAPRGRGMVLTPCETKTWALEQNLTVLTPEKIDQDCIDSLAAYQCEYAIVVAYGKILPQALINIFPLGILNIHYSLLPKYRGASPVEAALLHDENATGVTVQKMVFKLDAGDILAQQEVAIEPHETTRELRSRLITLGANLLIETLPSFIHGTATFTPQDESKATHSGKIKKEEGELLLEGDSQENWNKYRAFAESPGTYFYAKKAGNKIRVKITTASFKNDMFVVERVIPESKNEQSFVDFEKRLRTA